jgi:hypothetical protein
MIAHPLSFMPEPESSYRARRAYALVDRASARVRRRQASAIARYGYADEDRLYLQAWRTLQALIMAYYLHRADSRQVRS